jgi:hypothetical protein
MSNIMSPEAIPQIPAEEVLTPTEQAEVAAAVETATGHVTEEKSISQTGYQINPDGTIDRPGSDWDSA